MVAVNSFRAIMYGFRLIIYVIIVAILGIAPMVLGIKLFMEGKREGIFLMIIGFMITYAGSLGALYKVIADAVAFANKYTKEESDANNDVVEAIERLTDKIENLDDDS